MKRTSRMQLSKETLRHLDLAMVTGGWGWTDWPCPAPTPETAAFTNCNCSGTGGGGGITEITERKQKNPG